MRCVVAVNERMRLLLGSAAALLSAMTFGMNVPFVGVVYDHGGNIHAVNLVRPLVFLAGVMLWLGVKRRRVDLPARQGNWAFVLGAFFALEFYALHSAIHYMPVGLAILVMYTYPIIVAVLTARGSPDSG